MPIVLIFLLKARLEELGRKWRPTCQYERRELGLQEVFRTIFHFFCAVMQQYRCHLGTHTPLPNKKVFYVGAGNRLFALCIGF